jgi:hypothetical protein
LDEITALEERLEGEELKLENRRRSHEAVLQALGRASELGATELATLSSRETDLQRKLALQAQRVERIEERISTLEEND